MQLKQDSGGLIYNISATILNGSNVDVRPVEVWLMQSCRLAAHLKKKQKRACDGVFKILPHCQSSSDRHCRCFTMILSPGVEDPICHPIPPRKRTSRCKQVSGHSGNHGWIIISEKIYIDRIIQHRKCLRPPGPARGWALAAGAHL